MMKCIIIDDEPLARKILETYIQELDDLELIGNFKNPIEFKNSSMESDPDIIFVDINMPKMSGLEFVKTYQKSPHIVFTTAYPEHALEAFDLQATDYLVKPIALTRFMQTIDKIKNSYIPVQDSKTWISIKENKRLYRVSTKDISYLQAYGDYVKILGHPKSYITKSTLVALLPDLGSRFVQIHRSYIINLDAVKYVEGNRVVLDTEKLPVSQKYRQDLLNKMQS